MTQQQSDSKAPTRTVIKVRPVYGKEYWYGTMVYYAPEYERVSCDHHHRSPEAAQKCADAQ